MFCEARLGKKARGKSRTNVFASLRAGLAYASPLAHTLGAGSGPSSIQL